MSVGIFVERALALDQASRDISRHRLHDVWNVVRLGEDMTAEAAVVKKAIATLVASHGDMGDRVDPQARRLAAADAAIEQIDLARNFSKQRIERFVQELKARHFGIAQIDDDAGALGRLDARLMDRVLQQAIGVAGGFRRRVGLAFTSPHLPSVPRTKQHARKDNQARKKTATIR